MEEEYLLEFQKQLVESIEEIIKDAEKMAQVFKNICVEINTEIEKIKL